MKIKYIVLSIIAFVMFWGCEDILQIDSPSNELASSDVFADARTANSAIEGIYAELELKSRDSDTYRIFYTDLASDLITHYSNAGLSNEFATFEIAPTNSFILSAWRTYYSIIYNANSAIDGLETQTYPTKDRLMGEAKFMRALMYFYLVNLYGDVPLITTTALSTTIDAPRSPQDEVYAQIIQDLEAAYSVLPEDYSHANGQKTRVNKWGAAALLSRIHLFLENWSEAQGLATEVINTNSYGLTALGQTFKVGSAEMILQFKPISVVSNRSEILAPYSLNGQPPQYPIAPELLSSFESNDQRKEAWILQSLYNGELISEPYKFTKMGTTNLPEYSPILRLAEMYLIRSEARAHLGNISGAQEDLNVIRNRAGLDDTTASTMEQLLLTIETERKHEFFVEEGHTWFDLKRTGRIAETVAAGIATYQPTDNLWPIPAVEIGNNLNLTQNPGY